MEEAEIKSEAKYVGENYADSPRSTNSPPNQDITQESPVNGDVKVIKKKRKMEIELDFSLIKDEYYKPRQRRAVKRYDDALLLNAETQRKKKEEFNLQVNDATEEILFCKDCNETFKEMRFLKIHRAAIHFKASKFTCALCSATFNSNSQLIEHKLVHKDEERNFLCMTCQTAFSDHLDYLKHKAKHEKESNYFCIECGKEYDNRTGYYLHIETHYYRVVECEICHRNCNANRIKNHMKTHNANHKSECVECGKAYDKKMMQYHMASHTGVKPFQCLYCGKGFAGKNQRTIHTRIHTGEKPFNCDICYRKFSQYTDMARHKSSHKKDPEMLECTVCKRKFKHKESLKFHMDIHNNTQKYTCKFCGFKVNTQTGLRSHFLRVHTEEKMYKCEPCEVAFKTPADLNKHKKNIKHKNNQYGYNKKLIKEEK